MRLPQGLSIFDELGFSSYVKGTFTFHFSTFHLWMWWNLSWYILSMKTLYNMVGISLWRRFTALDHSRHGVNKIRVPPQTRLTRILVIFIAKFPWITYTKHCFYCYDHNSLYTLKFTLLIHWNISLNQNYYLKWFNVSFL